MTGSSEWHEPGAGCRQLRKDNWWVKRRSVVRMPHADSLWLHCLPAQCARSIGVPEMLRCKGAARHPGRSGPGLVVIRRSCLHADLPFCLRDGRNAQQGSCCRDCRTLNGQAEEISTAVRERCSLQCFQHPVLPTHYVVTRRPAAVARCSRRDPGPANCANPLLGPADRSRAALRCQNGIGRAIR